MVSSVRRCHQLTPTTKYIEYKISNQITTYFQLLVAHQLFAENQLLFPVQIPFKVWCKPMSMDRGKETWCENQDLPQVVEHLLWRMNQMLSDSCNQCPGLSERCQRKHFRESESWMDISPYLQSWLMHKKNDRLEILPSPNGFEVIFQKHCKHIKWKHVNVDSHFQHQSYSFIHDFIELKLTSLWSKTILDEARQCWLFK